jgi:hypothetical protein
MQDIGQDPDQIINSVVLNGSGTVIEVAPGPDDTQALIDAFSEAAAAGKGSVVKLLPGTFEIGMIEVKEFSGTLTGSGKGNTIVTNRPDISPDEVIAQGKLPALISFIGGNVKVSDLSVQLTLTPWLEVKEFNMLLFSDYSIDFMPAKKHIGVQLENLEMTGLRRPVSPFLPFPVTGVKCAPDIQKNSVGEYPRSNIDITVANSKFSTLLRGIYVWGCKKGELRFGTEAGNIFDGNRWGLLVNENLDVHVKIWNNVFYTPSRHGNGIDLNTGEAALNNKNPLEIIDVDPGTYEIRNNIFNVTGPSANAIGLMDTWRLAHPEYPYWMKMIWEDNTFVLTNQGSFIGWTYCIKNMLFVNNTITGNDVPNSFMINTTFYWSTVLPNNSSEGCKFINNHFLRKNFIFFLDLNVNNYLLMGDLTNVTVQDFGEGNMIIDKMNPNHANGTNNLEIMELKVRELKMFDQGYDH